MALITNFNQQALDQQMLIQSMRARQFGGGCGCGPTPGPWGPPQWSQGHGNLPYAQVGNRNLFDWNGQRGFAVDMNNNGRYDRGQDAVLAMDLNRDGRVSKDEIEQSQRRLQAFGGNYDFNHDGNVSLIERLQGGSYRRQMQQYDSNRDGQLQPWEFSNAGGRVLVDGNRDGNFQPWEQHSPYNFPTPGFGRGSLGTVNPWGGTQVQHQGGWGGGFGGGWGGGFGGGYRY